MQKRRLCEFVDARCRLCGPLRAMEAGVLHVDTEFDVGWRISVHIFTLAPYHRFIWECVATNFVDRVCALKPCARIVWTQCLSGKVPDKCWAQVLAMDYLWRDLSVVHQAITAAPQPVPSVFLQEMDKRWEASCRRAWIASVVI